MTVVTTLLNRGEGRSHRGHHQGRHNQRYRQHHKHALHAHPPLLWRQQVAPLAPFVPQVPYIQDEVLSLCLFLLRPCLKM
jgi:hypothetical protein